MPKDILRSGNFGEKSKIVIQWRKAGLKVSRGGKLRVIAGSWKGRQLQGPKGSNVRPTTDRVKESMFNLIGMDFCDDPVVDLFAGSGALGIEALSRGSESAIFVDKSGGSLQTVRQNLGLCQVEAGRAVLWKMDWRRAVERLGEERVQVGWIFVDPPYPLNLWTPVLEALDTQNVQVVGGVVCEHPKGVALPSLTGTFEAYKERTYGDIQLTLYRVKQGPKDDDV